MLKKFVVIGALCFGLMGFWSIDAHAWPASSSGWGATQNTVTIHSGWKGISNVELRPTTVRVTLDCVVVAAQCVNNGGNEGGLGNPFMIPGPVVGSQTSPMKAIKNGNWLSDITFDEMEDFKLTLNDAYCINPNWKNVGFVTKSFIVYIRAFEDVNTRCTTTADSGTICSSYPSRCDTDTCFTACTYVPATDVTTCYGPSSQYPWTFEEVVHIEGSCDLGSAPIGVDSSYTCNTDYQWEYSKRSPTCGSSCYYP